MSPVNIWEGKSMVTKKHRIETGQESALYYEVVQTGNPSYAYLNATNNAMTQASVMAHVIGHCEFSELNVLRDSTPDRTEFVMHLVRKVKLGRQQMGDTHYRQYWNACESVTSLIAPHSQYNLAHSVESEIKLFPDPLPEPKPLKADSYFTPYSSTVEHLFHPQKIEIAFKQDLQQKIKSETLSRSGYKLKVPCQDVFGFLRYYAPGSRAEKSLMDYLYTVHAPQDFVLRTQIMNEGWAMYWEKKIMLELFKEKAVKGIIEYARTFSGVCYPRPYFMRNPYHVGYHLWCHIETLYRKGKVSLDFLEESDQKKKEAWEKHPKKDPISEMEHLIHTMTDFEFLRRFLTPPLIEEFQLNKVDKRLVRRLGISPDMINREDGHFSYLDPTEVKQEMLTFFTHFDRPRLYVIDSDFRDGGILLFHRNDGRHLKRSWIEPTLKNINYLWNGPVFLATQNTLYHYSANRFKKTEIPELFFEIIVERMQNNEKPFAWDE
jgi:stage V sporulation protein R